MACSCGEDEAPLSQAWRARVRGGGHQSRAQRTLPHVQAAVNGRNSNFVLFLSAPSQSALPGTANLLFLELFLSGLAASGPGIVGIANIGISGAIPMTSVSYGSDAQDWRGALRNALERDVDVKRGFATHTH